MEVSGKKHDTRGICGRKPSGPSKRLICQPCSADGEDLEADGFCQNCQEYLCRTCIRYHRKATLSKNHVILDGENMPKNAQTQKQICTLTCQKHVLEVVKFFCKDHNKVGCGTCMVLEHKTCSVDFIPDIADDFVSGPEYKTLLQRLEQLQSSITISKEQLEKCEKEAAEAYVTAIESISSFRKEMNMHLDQMEQCIVSECDRLKKENEETMEQIDEDLRSFKSELDVIGDRLSSQATLTGDLFVHAKHTSKLLDELEQDMARKTIRTLKTYEFERERDLEDIVSKMSPFGKLVLHTKTLRSFETTSIVDFVPMYAGEINVGYSDKNRTYISGMITMTDDTLLCVDRNNRSVKVVDTENGCLSSQVTMESGPWDITSLSQDEVAVTVPDKKQIEFMFLKDKSLSRGRSMEVRSECRGIAYTENKLVVSYENRNIEIMTLSGEVLKVFMAGNQSDSSISWPGCVTVGTNGDCIFVSDLQRHSVFKMSFEGELLGTYQDTALKYPRALTVCKDGSVLVCSSEGHSVHLISPSCKKVKLLLTESEAEYAQSVSYNETTSTLYLYNSDENVPYHDTNFDIIRVYKST